MKRIAIVLALVLWTGVCAQQQYYPVTAGNGYGLRFWNSDNYKIHMGNTSEYQYGPVTDYSIKMNMNSDTKRGWTWGIIGLRPIAGLNTQGNFQIAGYFNATNYISVSRNGSYRVAMNGQGNGYITGRNDAIAQKFLIHTSGPSYLNGGNVGIGTETPRTKLQVLGPSETQSSFITAFGNLSSNDLVTSNTYRSFFGSTFTDGSSTNIGRYFSYRSIHGGYLNYDNRGYGFYSQGGYPRMFLEVISGNHGSINGLPSDSPIKSGYLYQQIKGPSDNALSIPIKATNSNSQWLWGVKSTGDIIVAGKVESREVKVTVDAGADYVFNTDYDLKSLQEVQDHIKEHGHLPNIPSAREMEANGIELGQMNLKLLEKIEELTLYVIELKKQNEQQQEEIEELKKNKQ